MSSSNYPRLLDNDANLFRPVAATAATPSLFIGHTDAIERIEPSVGTCDDGTAFGIAGTFNRGLMDHVGLPTTCGPNGRYPWLPRAANSMYATDGSVPAGWTVSPGLSVSFGPPKGFAKVTFPADNTARLLTMALAGVAPFHVMMRMRFVCSSKGTGGMSAGFSILGQTSDMSGIYLAANYVQAQALGVTVGDHPGSATILTPQRWLGVWMVQTATTITVYLSGDMYTWDEFYSGAAVQASTKFIVVPFEPADTPNQVAQLWLDYLTFGNVQPQGL